MSKKETTRGRETRQEKASTSSGNSGSFQVGQTSSGTAHNYNNWLATQRLHPLASGTRRNMRLTLRSPGHTRRFAADGAQSGRMIGNLAGAGFSRRLASSMCLSMTPAFT